MYTHVSHDFGPVFDTKSKILILGTMPSVKSREGHFYYHHPQNRFWKVIAALLQVEVPQTIAEKKAMLLQGGVAVWDVIASCDIEGSSDSSIRNVEANDIGFLLRRAPIERIFANGAKAAQLYDRYCFPGTGMPAAKLPSTSPANAAWSLERLIKKWRLEICGC